MKRPLLEESNEIHPVLDFKKDNYYLGVWLDCVIKNKKNENEVQKILFVKTKDGLTALDELKGFKDREICGFQTRISSCLLTDSQKSLERMSEIDQTVMSLGFDIPTNWIKTSFEVIRKIYKDYMDYSESEAYDFMPIWIIGTYFHPIFYSYPYLHIHGLSGTGKTRNLEIAAWLAFNATESGSMSDASLFRLIESIRPTLLIDETDALADKKNRPTFRELLLSGYKKFGKAWRAEKKTAFSVTHTPQTFEVYSPKITANIEGLEQVLSARAIRITMWRSNSEKYSKEISDNEEFKLARDCLYLALFNNFNEIRTAYDKLEKIDGMMNRDWELWKPILTIASLLGEEVFNNIKAFALKRITENQAMMNTESSEYKLVKALYRIASVTEWYNLKDIKIAWTNEFEEGEGGWITANYTVKVMERLGFHEVRTYNGYKQFRITKEFVDELIKRLNIDVKDIKPLVDKKISHLPEKIVDFIRTKNAPTRTEIREYFESLGINPIELENVIAKLLRDGILMEKTPVRLDVV